jgi:hypothetical protein
VQKTGHAGFTLLIFIIRGTPLLISANGFAFRGATLSLLTSLRGLNIVASPPQESTPFAPINSYKTFYYSFLLLLSAADKKCVVNEHHTFFELDFMIS